MQGLSLRYNAIKILFDKDVLKIWIASSMICTVKHLQFIAAMRKAARKRSCAFEGNELWKIQFARQSTISSRNMIHLLSRQSMMDNLLSHAHSLSKSL